MKKTVLLLLTFLTCISLQAQLITHDSTFNSIGYAHAISPGDETEFREVKVNPDGSIIAAGLFNYYYLIIAKYKADGSLDPSFGTDGVTTYGGEYAYRTYSMYLLNDGKILISGEYINTDGYDLDMLIRFNSDGTIDESFGIDGIAPFVYDKGYSSVFNIDVQSDGKIIAVGKYSNFAQDTVRSFIIRYTADGEFDESFAGDGIYETDFSVSLNDIKVQEDGNIVTIGGYVDDDMIEYLYAMRLLQDGTIDNSFGTDGIFTYYIPVHLAPYSCSIILQPDGKIVFNGTTRLAAGSFAPGLIIGRLLSNGSFDPAFDSDGYVLNNFELDNFYALDIALQADGKILTSGNAFNDSDLSDQIICRYLPDGQIDSSFNLTGYTNNFTPWEDNYNTSIELQDDGKILYVGTEFSSEVLNSFIGRLTNFIEPVAVQNMQQASLVSVYPVPADDILEIHLNGDNGNEYKIKIYDIAGRQVAEYNNMQENLEIETSSYKNGLYILYTTVNGFTYVKKIIVAHK